jgi:hypothetical protein
MASTATAVAPEIGDLAATKKMNGEAKENGQPDIKNNMNNMNMNNIEMPTEKKPMAMNGVKSE